MNDLKKEIKKIIANKIYVFFNIVFIIMASIDAMLTISSYRKHVTTLEQLQSTNQLYQNPLIPTYSVYTLWIGGDNATLISMILYHLAPILVIMFACTRSQKHNSKENIIAKNISLFISTGLIPMIFLIINFMIISIYIPAITPDAVYDIYYGVFSNSFLGNIFYTAPILYIIIFIQFVSIHCGLIGSLCYSMLFLFKNRFVTFIVCCSLFYIAHFTAKICTGIEISPIILWNSATVMFDNWIWVSLEMTIIFIVIVIINAKAICDKKISERMECSNEK